MLPIKNVGTSHCLKHSANNNNPTRFHLLCQSSQDSQVMQTACWWEHLNTQLHSRKTMPFTMETSQTISLAEHHNGNSNLEGTILTKIRNQHGRTNHKKKGKAERHMPALASTDTSRTNFLNPLTENWQVWELFFFEIKLTIPCQIHRLIKTTVSQNKAIRERPDS